MTRLEIATLACKILALWMFAQIASAGAGIIVLLVVDLVGRSTWDIGMPLISLTFLVGQLVIGLLCWFRAEGIAGRMVSHDSTPVTGSHITQAGWMAVAFCAVGMFTLIPALQTVSRYVVEAASGVYRYSQLWGSPSWEANLWSSVAVAAVSLWLILDTHGIVRLVLWARSAAGRRGDETPGMCAKCGYDLRATPDRCPECGTIPQK